MSYEIEKEWMTAADLRAVVIRTTALWRSHRCGYVEVPAGHPMYNKHYDSLDIEAHGGLTYSDLSNTYPVATAALVNWIGFDCAHAGDDEPGGQSLEYCIAECEIIAQQLKAKA